MNKKGETLFAVLKKLLQRMFEALFRYYFSLYLLVHIFVELYRIMPILSYIFARHNVREVKYINAFSMFNLDIFCDNQS